MNVSLRQYWALLKTYLLPQRAKGLLLIMLLGSIGLQLVSPQIIRWFIDTATTGGAMRSLVVAALLFIGAALLQQLLAVGATYYGELVSWAATNLMRRDLARHALALDLPFHQTHAPGEMIERIDGDITALSKFFSQIVTQVFGSGLLLVGVLIVLFAEDWRVGTALALFALLALGALIGTRNLAVAAMTEDREAHAQLFSFVEERVAGLDDLRANGAGSYVMRRMYGLMRTVAQKGRAAIMRSVNIWGLNMGLFALGYAMALALGASLFLRGSISIGTVYLIFQYTEMLRRPLEQISAQLQELQRAAAGIGRVQEVFALTSVVADGLGADFVQDAPAVEFEHVAFTYGGGRTIHDLSFALQPGTILGLLGRTGSGKTTLTRLLLRLYDPQEGAIRIAGADLRALRLHELRQRVGIVTQDVHLFQATVRDNLTLFDPSISDERIMAALHELALDDWLGELPDGLNTVLADNGLSAGEAQLLAFARVFLRDPAIVVLDEASSRLDPATEALIEQAVDRLLRGRTGLIIAHRLRTVQRADEIMILDGGRIAEYGPRAVLAANAESRFAHLLYTGMEEVLA